MSDDLPTKVKSYTISPVSLTEISISIILPSNLLAFVSFTVNPWLDKNCLTLASNTIGVFDGDILSAKASLNDCTTPRTLFKSFDVFGTSKI